MKSIGRLYKNAYSGLSQESWMLALVILINRSGSIVLPFLSIYLTSALGFEVKQAGLIISMYGAGSVIGGLAGGWLTDKVGHFWVQFLSLIISGIGFISLAYLNDFYALLLGVFSVSMIAESLRPANASSIAYYAKPENLTRAFSLNRMAVNLGFSIGPALGGFLAGISFKWLFLADGVTCFTAGMLFFFYFRHRAGRREQVRPSSSNIPIKEQSPFKDGLYLGFIVLVCLYAAAFFQLFMTFPLYYKEVYDFSAWSIGAMLTLNGAIVFLVEMILVYAIGTRYKLAHLIAFGTFLLALSFLCLFALKGVWVLVLSMLLLSISEILAMPYMATLAVERAAFAKRGSYMGLYTVAYSSAFIIAPLFGTYVIHDFGFDALWMILSVFCVILSFLLFIIVKKFAPMVTLDSN